MAMLLYKALLDIHMQNIQSVISSRSVTCGELNSFNNSATLLNFNVIHTVEKNT
jgi:hypothetical protein